MSALQSNYQIKHKHAYICGFCGLEHFCYWNSHALQSNKTRKAWKALLLKSNVYNQACNLARQTSVPWHVKSELQHQCPCWFYWFPRAKTLASENNWHFPSCSPCLRDRRCLSSTPSLGYHKSNARTQGLKGRQIHCAASALLVLPPNANKRFPQRCSPSCLSTDSGWAWYSTELFRHYAHNLQHLMWTINGLMFIYLFGLVCFFGCFLPSALS